MKQGDSKITDEMAAEAAVKIHGGATMAHVAKEMGVAWMTLAKAFHTRGWMAGSGMVIVPYDVFVRYGSAEAERRRVAFRGNYAISARLKHSSVVMERTP